MTLCRRDIPFLIVFVVLALLYLASLVARPAEPSGALEQVASEVASKVAGDLAGKLAGEKLMDAVGSLSLAGVLWFYSRQFYLDKKASDAAMLQDKKESAATMLKIVKDYATLTERVANALDNMNQGKPNTNRFTRGQATEQNPS